MKNKKENRKKLCKIELEDSKQSLIVPIGTNLRDALIKHYKALYHPPMKWIHCRGFGTCGTCALKVEGELSPPTAVERWRLNFPPHKGSLEKGVRLSCQSSVLGPLKIKKLSGRWGQGPI